MILIVSSTNRPSSLTLRLAHVYRDRVKHHAPDQIVELVDLCHLPPDFIVSDLYGLRSTAFRQEEERLQGCTHLIFIVPEYNGSLPGILKLWIDAMTYGAFVGKQAALVGLAAGMFGNARGLDHLSGILNYLQVNVLPYRIHLANADQLLTSGRGFSQPDILKQIDRQIAQLLKNPSS